MGLKLTNEETTAWMGLVKSRQYLIERVEHELKQNGFPPLSWYDVLLELDNAPDGSLRLNDLGRRVLLNKYNVTRLIDRLEKEGLVSRNACQIDGRGRFACITLKGRDLRKRMWPVYFNVIKDHFLSRFNSEELARFVECVEKIRTQFE